MSNSSPFCHAQVDEIKVTPSHAPEHEGHGLVIKIKGTKPAFLTTPPHIALDVKADAHFWTVAGRAYSDFAVSLAR